MNQLLKQALLVGALGVLVVSPAKAIPITTPTDLSFGDQYRLAFVTTDTRNALSADIEDYNAFCNRRRELTGCH